MEVGWGKDYMVGRGELVSGEIEGRSSKMSMTI